MGSSSHRTRAARRAGALRERARGCHRPHDRASAAREAPRVFVTSGRRLGSSARLRSRACHPGAWRQRRRCCHCHVVRAGCRRARCVWHRWRWAGRVVPERDAAALCSRFQGPDTGRRDARQSPDLQRHSTRWRRTALGQHPGRRGRDGLPALEVWERTDVLVRPDCSGRGVRRAGVRARPDAALEYRGRPAVLSEVHRSVAHLPSQWPGAEGGGPLRQSRLRDDPSHHCLRGRRVVLPWVAGAPHRRRYAGQ